MKWPFARHHRVADVNTSQDERGGHLDRSVDVDLLPARRDWARLPPMTVAGEKPIHLTAPTRAFTRGLATQQVLVQSPRLEVIRHVDAPSGSFRGVLSPAVADHEPAPPLMESSPLPEIAHRRLVSLPREATQSGAPSAVDELLAIGDQDARDRPLPEAPTLQPARESTDQSPAQEPRQGGQRMGLAESRRLGLGPAYHGPLPEAMQAERERVEAPAGVVDEIVPGAVRAAMREVLGVDVGERLVHRGPAVSAEAQSLGAQAFTRDGEVFVSDEVGPLDAAQGRATVAHELTHAAQQAVHGTPPDEGSVAGQMMEVHAQRVEQYVRGDASATKPSPEMLHARPAPSATDDAVASSRQMMRELIDTGLAEPDGQGGIIFTLPPSAMTGSTGTQRAAAAAPPAQTGGAAQEEHWNPLAKMGHSIVQGLGSDILEMTGSVLGFSDEFMGEQRKGLADADREFRRDQTKQAYIELRMDHLREVKLKEVNADETAHHHQPSTSLHDDTVEAIKQQVDHEVNQRMELLKAQADQALAQLNQARASSQQAALESVPDESYDKAFHRLFDDPMKDDLPAADELLAALSEAASKPGPGAAKPAAKATGGAKSPTPPEGSAKTTTPGATAATGTKSAGAGGAGAEGSAAQPWRTEETIGGRFKAFGNALAADIANEEIEIFGGLLGFDEKFEKGLHDDVAHSQGTAAKSGPGAAKSTSAANAAPKTAPGAKEDHPAAGGAAAHADAVGHETVDHIVADPYALNELATRLYPNIRSRLRQELLIDRERAGLLADFR
jgi:Domain of unknown function (DUF4157)